MYDNVAVCIKNALADVGRSEGHVYLDDNGGSRVKVRFGTTDRYRVGRPGHHRPEGFSREDAPYFHSCHDSVLSIERTDPTGLTQSHATCLSHNCEEGTTPVSNSGTAHAARRADRGLVVTGERVGEVGAVVTVHAALAET